MSHRQGCRSAVRLEAGGSVTAPSANSRHHRRRAPAVALAEGRGGVPGVQHGHLRPSSPPRRRRSPSLTRSGLAATGMTLATFRCARTGSRGSVRLSRCWPGTGWCCHERLWLGMMPDSTGVERPQAGRAIRPAHGDRRQDGERGDVKFWGTATQVTDHDTLVRFADAIFESVGYRFEGGDLRRLRPRPAGRVVREGRQGHPVREHLDAGGRGQGRGEEVIRRILRSSTSWTTVATWVPSVVNT